MERPTARPFNWHYGLIAPLLIFLSLTFLIPLGLVFWTSVSDRELPNALPHLAAVLRGWDGEGAPPEAAQAALAEDLRATPPEKLAALGRRLSYEDPRLNALLRQTAQQLKTTNSGPSQINPRWLDEGTWRILKRAAGPVDTFYLLAAFDLRWEFGQGLVDAYKTGGLYRLILLRTVIIAALTSVSAIVLGFPLCYYLSRTSAVIRQVAVIVIMLPFWTSIVVRTTAWIVLLQDRGVVNRLLQAIGITDHPLGLLYNRFAVVVVMTHVMLPFLALPLLASMRATDDRLMQAASSLGAYPLYAFRRVYLPQVIPGLAAGAMLVFVSSLGFYITPALVGGPGDQTIGNYITLFTVGTSNWGLAASLGLTLTILTAFLLTLKYVMPRTLRTASR
ncbi:ABC transporter permease [Labrys okinawensis]|uniref:ABC transporter permease n=1 Tax=Labrys okinawensis TaxID=346911 RepID=UPI0039BD3538